MHDERDLRPMPAKARRSADRQRDDCLFLLESGPAARLGRLAKPGRTLAPEHRAREDHRRLGAEAAGSRQRNALKCDALLDLAEPAMPPAARIRLRAAPRQ